MNESRKIQWHKELLLLYIGESELKIQWELKQ